MEQLNLLLREVIAQVVVMQAYTKGWLAARRYLKEKQKRCHGAVIIQSGTLVLMEEQVEERKLLKLKSKTGKSKMSSDVFFYLLIIKQLQI